MQPKLVIVLVVGFLVAAIIWFSGVLDQHLAPGTKQAPAPYSGPTQRVGSEPVVAYEAVPGQVIAQQNTKVAARVMAQIEQITVRAGDMVEQGQVLIRLDEQELTTQLQQAKAQVQALQASFTQAQKQLQRAKELFAQGLIAQSDIDAATANHDNLSASLQQARQRQQQAQVALSYATITAPISGRVVERFAEPGDTATPGRDLLAIYNPQQLQLEFAVRERQAVNLRLGDMRQVEVPALGVSEATELVEIVPAADSASRSLLVRMAAPENAQLLPGLYAQLQLPLPQHEAVMISPQYVHSYGQLDMVLVVENQQLVRRYVRLGRVIGEQVEVLSGLRPGDEIAVEAQPNQL
ncbi:efflux RND transporter periplasmic adaptor subunit [Pseudoalteromonas sp. T1lg75]|uniref:efflux RND transporter periplasmic adaptor subunit n=1 Tax=Pseudoalteromonas sp. T1lg75 TaxID=2077102 RepID=UPI00131A3F2D|nr:efflux RND transporter periplasmic adaptor subunit [Pseudoalteromonas sp. T1lg75]